MLEVRRLSILGAGSWGTTLSWLLASHGKEITLWTSDKAKAERLAYDRRTNKPLPVDIPKSVQVTSCLDSCIKDADALVFCCTSQTLRQLAKRVYDSMVFLDIKRPLVLISAVKGFELTSLKRMSEVLLEIMPDAPVCVLSGPNLASEILQGLPAATVVASSSREIAQAVQTAFTVTGFRVYLNEDVIGVELGGTLKNIIAIAAGVSDGLKLGNNAKAALLTRGIAEMTRLSVALGAKAATLTGLAGMGDLFTTAASPHSRNYQLGLELARGRPIDEIINKIGAVIEGVATTEAVCELSNKLKLQLPIAEQVNETLKGKTTPEQAIMMLMRRPLSAE